MTLAAFASPLSLQFSPSTPLAHERRRPQRLFLRAVIDHRRKSPSRGKSSRHRAEQFNEFPTFDFQAPEQLASKQGFKKERNNSTENDARHELKERSSKRTPSFARRSLVRDGVSLRELVLGAEMQGVVQNLVKHGAYVDVGAVTDGLVHIRDMSVEFVHSPKDMVRTGDKVTVWVKYVNPVTNILGLTMVKPKMGFKDRMQVVDIEAGNRYEGIVERVTNYGAYVDIGAERLGFLHVAAMWGRKPRETLEYLRLGQSIWVHVDDVDSVRSHIKLRARGKNGNQLTESGPLGDLAKPEDVVREDGVVAKSEIVSQRVLLRPGDEALYENEGKEDEEVEEEDDDDVDDEFDDYDLEEDITRPSFLAGEDEIGHMFSGSTEFVGFDNEKPEVEDDNEDVWKDFEKIRD